MTRPRHFTLVAFIILSYPASAFASVNAMPLWNQTVVDDAALIKSYADSYEVVVCGYLTIQKYPARNYPVDELVFGDDRVTDWTAGARVFPSMLSPQLDRGFFIAGFRSLRSTRLAIQGISFTGYYYYQFMRYQSTVVNGMDRLLVFDVQPGVNFLGLVDVELSQDRLILSNRIWGVTGVDTEARFASEKLRGQSPGLRFTPGNTRFAPPVQKSRTSDQEAPVIDKTKDGIDIYVMPSEHRTALKTSTRIEVAGVPVLVIPILGGMVGTHYFENYILSFFMNGHPSVVRSKRVKRDEVLIEAGDSAVQDPYYIYYGEFYATIFSDFMGKAPAGKKTDRDHVMLMVYNVKKDEVEFMATMKGGTFERALMKALRQAKDGKLPELFEIPLTALLYRMFPY